MVCNNVAIVKAVVSEGERSAGSQSSLTPRGMSSSPLLPFPPPLASVYLPTQERGKDCAVTESEILLVFSHCTEVDTTRTCFVDA